MNANPHVRGLTYEARCGAHRRTVFTFTPTELEMTSGEYKQRVVIARHRQEAGCICKDPPYR